MADLFPIRCFDCNRVINRYFTPFSKMVSREVSDIKDTASKEILDRIKSLKFDDGHTLSKADVLNILKIKSYCCRIRFLTFVEIPKSEPYKFQEIYTHVEFLNVDIEPEKKKKRSLLAR